MTPASIIAALDRGTAKAGEDIKLRRTSGTQQIPLEVECRAVVRGYKPAELIGALKQGDTLVILSPTEMQQHQWCWPPRKNDKAVIQGRTRNVEAADPIHVAGELVRIELVVRG